MRICVISAMESEHRQLTGRLEGKTAESDGIYNYARGRVGGNELVLMQCGIAKVNAALGAQAVINRYHPDCILSTGVAGGIDSSLRVGDVVVSNKVVHHDVWCGDGNEKGQVQGLPTYFPVSETLLRHALNLNNTHHEDKTRIVPGLICTGEQFVSDRQQLAQIKRDFPEGMAVDMESAAIAQTCYIYGVPFLSFRIISDTPGATEDNFSQYRDFWKAIAQQCFHTTWSFLYTLPEKL